MKLLARLLACCFLTAVLTQNIFGQNIALPAGPLPANTLAQIQALQQEKLARSPAQKKMDSHLIQASKRNKGQLMAPGVAHLLVEPLVDAKNMVLVDLRATVTPRLLEVIRKAGGEIISSFPEHNAIRARLPIGAVEDVAGDTDVKSLHAADLGYANAGSVTSEADATHRAGSSRTNYGVNGSGIKVGVLSDSVRFLGTSIALGDLDNSVVVMPGQDGLGTPGPDIGEGTAMLELVHDIVPGAQLYFATAKGGMSQMAANIRALRDQGCRVIIDDFTYAVESPFQDGVIDQAVQDVSDSGVLFFSSAANSGNLDSGQSGTWEGDFNPGVYVNGTGTFHNWGGGNYTNEVLGSATNTVVLFWAEPISIASSDYDVFTYDPAGNVVSSGNSTTADGYETALARPNDRIAVVLANGSPKFIHTEVIHSRLSTSTTGSTRGHNAPTAANAFGVAATPVRGPFPNAFSSANIVEAFSSDGPRRKFFYADATPMTPGNFSSTGGIVYQKPDITAADGATMSGAFTTNSPLQPFFGTSAAAPHAGAIAALLLSYQPSLTPAQVRAALQNTAIDIQGTGWDRNSGWGIIMADRALAFVSGPPDVQIAAPVAGSGYNSVSTITGTATDHSQSGLLRIDLMIAQGSDFWNGSSWSPAQTVLHPAVGTSWSYSSVPAGANLRGGSYVVTAAALDNASHTSSVASVTFQVDIQPPTVTFAPLTNQQVVFNFAQLGGTISETGTVKFKIEWFRAGGNEFWNGVNWSSDSSDANTLLAANVSGLNWTPANGTLPSRAQTFPGNYLIHAYVTDTSGNTNYNNLVVQRSPLDTTPPIVTLETIHGGDVLTNAALPGLFGSTLDNESGIASVSVFLNRFSNGDILYWNGSSWSGSPVALTAAYDPQTVAWQVTNALPSGANLPNAAYQVQVSVQNQESPTVVGLLSVSFAVDYHPIYVFNYGSQSGPTPNMNWSDAANWDVGSLPTPDARVIINGYSPDNTSLGSLPLYRLDMSGGNLTTAGMLIQKLNFSGGAITGGTINIQTNGVFNWSGGTLSGTCGILSNATLNIAGASVTLGYSTTLDNFGTINWTTNSTLFGAAGTVINNHNLINVEGGSQFYNYTGGSPAPTFNNYGTLRKISGTNATSVTAANGGWIFNHYGLLDVQTGAFSFQTIANLQTGGSFSGAGATRIEAGTTTLFGNSTILAGGTVELAGGTMIGSGGFLGAGTFAWSSGSANGNHTIAARLLIKDNTDKAMIGQLTNTSTNGVWTGLGTINCYAGGVLNNAGTLTAQTDAQAYNVTGGSPVPRFVNTGMFIKSGGTNSTTFNFANGGVAFDNAGTILAQTGIISLAGGGAHSNGTFNAASGARVEFANGSHTINSPVTFAGAGRTRITGGALAFVNCTNAILGGATLELAGGSLDGNGGLTGPGTFEWSGGYQSAVLTLSSNLTAQWSSSSDKILAGGTINNFGTLTWTGAGALLGAANAVVNNSGIFNVQNDSPFFNYTGGAPTPAINNTGTMRKTLATGQTIISSANGGWIFANSGLVDIQTGVLSSQSQFNVNDGGSFSGAGITRIDGGIATMNGSNYVASGAAFELATATMNGTGVFNGPGNLTWSTGTMQGNIGVAGAGHLLITGSAPKQLAGTFNNAGTGLWTGTGDLNISAGSAFNNSGTLMASNATQFFNNSGGAPQPLFNNSGTFIKTGNTNTTSFATPNGGVAFNNTGTATAETGVLALSGGGASSNAIFNALAGARIEFSGGTHFLNGGLNFTGAGTTRIAGGAVYSVGGTNTIAGGGTFELAAGSLDGSGGIRGPGTFGWIGGNISATLYLQTNLSFAISGASDKALAGGIVNNAGTATWTGTGSFLGAAGCAFNNAGTLNLQNDALFFNYTGGAPTPVLNNTGTIRKTTATGDTAIQSANGGWIFANSGLVDIQTGALVSRSQFNVNAGGTFSGAGVTRVESGAATMSGASVLSGGNFQLVPGGLLNGDGAFTGNGAFTWSGGSMNGNLSIGSSANLVLSGAAGRALNGKITNAGTATWTGLGVINCAAGSEFNNSGTFLAQNDAQFYNYTGGAPTPLFNNTGTFRKSSTTGTTTFSLASGGVNFNNLGTVDLRSGMLSINAGYATSPTEQLKISIGGPNAGTQFGQENFGPALFDGTLVITFTNGFVPTNGQSFALATFSSSTGQFSATQFPPLPVESRWQLSYTANSLLLQVVPSNVFAISSLTNGDFQFTFQGQTGSSCLIEVSTNLFVWDPLLTNAPFNGVLNYVDPQTSQFPKRFYRATIFP